MSEELNEAVIALASLRRDFDSAKNDVSDATYELEQTPQFERLKRLRSNKSLMGSAVDVEQQNVRLLAVDAYTDSVDEGNPNKSPHPAVSIAIGKRFVTAPDEALLTYCVDNLTAVLQVNRKKLLTIARATGNITSDGLNLVTVHDDPKARIKSDLSKWQAE